MGQWLVGRVRVRVRDEPVERVDGARVGVGAGRVVAPRLAEATAEAEEERDEREASQLLLLDSEYVVERRRALGGAVLVVLAC